MPILLAADFQAGHPNPRAHKKNRRGVGDLLFGFSAGMIADVSGVAEKRLKWFEDYRIQRFGYQNH